MKKRLFSPLLAAALAAAVALTAAALPAFADGGEETPITIGQSQEQQAECTCTALCTGDSVNADCPVCGAGGADLTACKGVESQPDTQAKAASAPAVTPRIAYDTLRIGNTRITDSGYWTTDGNGNLTASDAGNYNVAFDADTNTLSLNNATIVGSYDANNNPEGTGIYVGSRSGAVSLTIQVTGNNVVSGSYGIYALSNGGEVSVTISGGGSLTASGSQNGISIVSEFSNAALAIEGTAVKASGSYSEGVWVQAGESSTGSLSVDGGSLTASGNTGIEFLFSTGMSGSGTPSLTVAGNAVVDAKSGGIAHNSSNNLSIQGNSGIVFNGSTGTVYGNASLQEDLIIGEGESLTLDDGASLDANGHNVIVDGGILDEGIKNNLGDSVKYTPTITTASLPSGTVGTEYSTTLAAEGTAPITWSVSNGDLPVGLSLDVSTGMISGTPTAEGESTFTVEAANDYGSDSREFTLTIGVQAVTGVKLNKNTTTIKVGGTETLTATVEPANATNKAVTWSSDNISVATVDANGLVTAVAEGSATITVTTEDGNKTATCTVIVTNNGSGPVVPPQPSDPAPSQPEGGGSSGSTSAASRQQGPVVHNVSNSSAYRKGEYEFWMKVRTKIVSAGPGEVIEVNAHDNDKMPNSVMQALAAKEDVTLRIRWNDGEEIVIPSAAALQEKMRMFYPLSYLAKFDFTQTPAKRVK